MLGLTYSSATFFANVHSTLLDLLKGLATRPRVENDVYILCNRYIPNLTLRLLCVGGEKRAWCALFAHAPGFLEIYWEWELLTSARHADFSRIKDGCHWPRSVWMMTRERRRHSALRLQELSTHCQFQLNAVASDWRNFSLWSSAITSNEACRPLLLKQWLQNSSYEFHREYNYPCSAATQQVNRNWP